MSFVPGHALVSAPGVAPSRWMLVLHGLLGSGANFRTFARRLATACPAWGFVLVDQRMHGQSQGAPPPHGIASAADDLVRLQGALALPVAGVMGHSFGGKVALAFAERAPRGLSQVWVLDASPGVRRDRASTTEAVIRTLRAVPEPLPSRERFLEIVAEHGHPPAVAEWLAMNVRRAGDGFRLRLDLDAMEALIASYAATDLWPVLERAASTPGDAVFHVVVAGRSDALDGADRARLAAIVEASRGARGQSPAPRVQAHLIEGAGHWVHVDAPDALFDLLRAALS